MKAIIIANGKIKNFEILRKNLTPTDIIVCCDGGVKYAFEEGLIPHYIIGDLDSASPQIVQFFESKGSIFKKFPVKKDETDFELALDFLINLGISEILAFGSTGSRLDHTLTNINLLLKAYNSNVKVSILDENNCIQLIGPNKEFEVIGEKGELISLIPLGLEVFIEYALGFEYELKNEKLFIASSRCISNTIKSTKCKIKLKKGYLFLIKSKD